jgi:hypothetical protein
MGYGRRRLVRNLWGSLAVAGVMASIGLGLPAINKEVPAVQPVAANRPYPVGAGVTVLPPSGASLDASQTRPGTSNGQVLFYIGSVRYALTAAPFTGTLAEATSSLRSRITATNGYQVTGPETTIATKAGVTGRQGMYASSGRDGRYAVFLNHGIAVEVTLAGNEIDLRPLLPEIEASILSIAFGAS